MRRRTLFVIFDEARRLMTARRARSFCFHLPLLFKGYGWVAKSLVLRSLERSERLALAALARGFEGRKIKIDE